MAAMPSLSFIAAFAATLVLLLVVAAGRRSAGSAADFTLAGRTAGSWQVGGAVMGTLVGGASTIGTAQMAFLFGLSAWWFTLGAGLACLLLGLLMAAPLRDGEVTTIPELLGRRHGEGARVAASLFSALGMFLHIVAQLLAAGSLLSSLFGLTPVPAALCSAALVLLVIQGRGMGGAGAVGLLKLLLLYLTLAAAGGMAFLRLGGFAGMREAFPPFPWFSLFGYGVGSGLSDLVSMLIGVLSTQTYLQALFAARDRRAARGGALLSALLIPPLGLFGIAVGLFMRRSQPDLDSVQALPAFLLAHFPAPLAGVAFATLLLAAVVTASGLALGTGTTLQVDILARWWRGGSELRRLRLVTTGVIALALTLLLANPGSAILSWSFLSMGLRGATLALPLLGALYLKEKTPARAGALAIVAAPLAVLASGLSGWPAIPPLFTGLGVAAALLLAGLLLQKPKGTFGPPSPGPPLH